MQKNTIQVQQDSFELGPLIEESLILWLDEKAANRIFQLPVEIHGGILGIESSFLRTENTEIEISLDTGAMSLDLSIHLKQYCNSYPCKVWLEGTWGALISNELLDTLPVFAVRKVIGVANDDDVNIRLPKY